WREGIVAGTGGEGELVRRRAAPGAGVNRHGGYGPGVLRVRDAVGRAGRRGPGEPLRGVVCEVEREGDAEAEETGGVTCAARRWRGTSRRPGRVDRGVCLKWQRHGQPPSGSWSRDCSTLNPPTAVFHVGSYAK